jgi:uncharacterized membrane protein
MGGWVIVNSVRNGTEVGAKIGMYMTVFFRVTSAATLPEQMHLAHMLCLGQAAETNTIIQSLLNLPYNGCQMKSTKAARNMNTHNVYSYC